MQKKVTNFEISKRLAELNFQCESHCGWWYPLGTYQTPSSLMVIDKVMWLEIELETPKKIKAYDCWDLSSCELLKHATYIWIDKDEIEVSVTLQEGSFLQDPYREAFVRDKQLQNTLGLAAIKILEEKGNE